MANAARHREALVRTAMRLFRRQGFSGTGLQEILAESGAPKGSLYHYFPGGKEAIGAAARSATGTRSQPSATTATITSQDFCIAILRSPPMRMARHRPTTSLEGEFFRREPVSVSRSSPAGRARSGARSGCRSRAPCC